MNSRQKHVYLPAALSAGSFIILALVSLLTSPIKNISFSILFFAALLGLFIGVGYVFIYVQNSKVSSKAWYRLIIISLLIVTILMLRSTQSLGWGDISVIFIISMMTLFYTSRRGA